MKQITRIAVAMLATLLLFIALPEAVFAEKGQLEGVWKNVEVSYTSHDTSWTRSDLQPSLYIFAKRHYSIMYVPGAASRTLFADLHPTDAEKIAAYDSFIANSGTYEAVGSTITIHPLVAKSPNFMAGESRAYAFEVKGDSLLLTYKSVLRPGGEYRMKLTRLE